MASPSQGGWMGGWRLYCMRWCDQRSSSHSLPPCSGCAVGSTCSTCRSIGRSGRSSYLTVCSLGNHLNSYLTHSALLPIYQHCTAASVEAYRWYIYGGSCMMIPAWTSTVSMHYCIEGPYRSTTSLIQGGLSIDCLLAYCSSFIQTYCCSFISS